MKRKLFLLLVTFFYTIAAQAQRWEVGVTAGSMGYIGDLNQNNYRKLTNFAFGGMVKNNIDGFWSIKLSVLKGQVEADDSKSKYQQERDRNLSFFSPITEASLQVEFNFFDYGRLFGKSRVTPFLFTGISGFTFNPQTKLNNTVYELKTYRTEGQEKEYKTSALAIPFGLGLKCNLTENLNLIGEIGYRKAFTDNLDDVSGYYPPTGSFSSSNPNQVAIHHALSDRSVSHIGTPGTQRGDFRKNDTYLFGGITLSYTFVSQKCYSF
jgi:hypothetical protein